MQSKTKATAALSAKMQMFGTVYVMVNNSAITWPIDIKQKLT